MSKYDEECAARNRLEELWNDDSTGSTTGDEFLKFERVTDKFSDRPDLHAFVLLDRLCPSSRGLDMVAGAEHDEIYLNVEPLELVKAATEEQLIDLHRCGVRIGENGLCMFV